MPFKTSLTKGLLPAMLCGSLLLGCQSDDKNSNDTADSASTNKDQSRITFSEQRLRQNIATLASDQFEGRQPSSVGETLTIEFLRDQFKALGLQPGNGDSYYQAVKLIEITADADMSLQISGGKNPIKLAYGSEMVAWTKRVTEQSSITDSELVFVGYGSVAPEYGWNDYAGMDFEGKTVVVLVNDPGYATQDPALFNGKAMTYYGRWTYKYEEAARQGAAGVILIHETGAASYPWAVVENGWTGPQFDLVSADNNMSRAAVESWVTEDSAKAIFEAAGMDYAKALEAAKQKGFKPQAMGLKASIALKNSFKESSSNNVIAIIPGSKRPHETVFYTAHWDHLGLKSQGDGHDHIYNGAVDNATGTAALIEIADAYMQGPAPERTVAFLAVTAEESGLLGSKYYAENPLYPLANTAAVINMDACNVFGRTSDVAVIGFGASELEEYLGDAAAKQNRTLTPDPKPERGSFYRSDHFSFAKKGVPAIYSKSGANYLDRPEGWGLETLAAFTAEHYHKPSDQYDESWDLSGMLEDMQLYFLVGQRVANESRFPNWYEGNEFRQIRDSSRAGVK